MTQKQLTDKEVKSLSKEIGRHAVGGAAGLVLSVRARQHGVSCTWLLRYIRGGRRTYYTLGTYPSMRLSEAREMAQGYRAQLDAGEDPRKGPSEAPDTAVASLLPAWLENLSDKHQYRRAGGVKRAEMYMRKHVLPRLGARHVEEIEAREIGEILTDLYNGQHGATADKVRKYLSSFFRWAKACGYIEQQKMLPTSPELINQLIPSPSARARGRVHQPMCPVDQLPEFVAALVDSPRINTVSGLALLFCILTASRIGNICATANTKETFANWNDIDLEHALWTIPAEKMKVEANGAHVVPLSAQAVALLRRLDALGKHSGAVVFPSPLNGEPITDMAVERQLKAVCVDFNAALPQGEAPHFIDPEAGGRLMTVHGTARASFETWAADNGANKELRDKALHHAADKNLGRAYDRSAAVEPRRELMQKWADYLFSKCREDWEGIER
jgi:integrase